MQKESIKFVDMAKTIVVVVTTLFFCLSMTTFDDSRAWFKLCFDLITSACIVYGLASNFIKYKKIDDNFWRSYHAAGFLSYRHQ